MPGGELIAREVVVHGRVQGVFFRASCADEAERLGVHGWVRNQVDGTVAAHFEGGRDAVEAMVEWCHQGPRHAAVTRVDVEESTATGATVFAVR